MSGHLLSSKPHSLLIQFCMSFYPSHSWLPLTVLPEFITRELAKIQSITLLKGFSSSLWSNRYPGPVPNYEDISSFAALQCGWWWSSLLCLTALALEMGVGVTSLFLISFSDHLLSSSFEFLALNLMSSNDILHCLSFLQPSIDLYPFSYILKILVPRPFQLSLALVLQSLCDFGIQINKLSYSSQFPGLFSFHHTIFILW